MLEVARKYEVDGLHFDYIRYPDRDKCYCDGCRSRFEQHTGKQVANWPTDCYSGELRDAYTQWRCDQITRLVKAVHDEAKQIRPGIAISAAVFGSLPQLPRIGGPGLAGVDQGRLSRLRLPDGLHAKRSGICRAGDEPTETGRRPDPALSGHWAVATDR